MQNAKCRMQNAELRIFLMQNAECRIADFKVGVILSL
jgi:hypothetical protein